MPTADPLAQQLMQWLRDAGVESIYGAPGTSELSLVAAAERVGIRYEFALHDAVAVGMADGFGRSTGRIGVANLHAAQGLLSSSGFVRVALRDRVPLLIINGLPATSYDVHEPNHQLLGLESVVRSITKWHWTVSNPKTALRSLQRAITLAHAEPAGPTWLGVPQDLLESPGAEPYTYDATHVPRPEVPTSAIEVAAGWLTRAKRPLIFAGFHARGCTSTVESLASFLGAPVLGESLDRGPQVHGVYCSVEHPLFAGYFSVRDADMSALLNESDVVLLVGARAAHERVVGELLREKAVITVAPSTMDLAMGPRATVVLQGDLETCVAALAARVGDQMQGSGARGRRRSESVAAQLADSRQRRMAPVNRMELRGSPVSPLQLVAALASAVPSKAIVVDDSQSFGYFLKTYYPFRSPGTLYGSLASHLGWALPAALGVKRGHPEALVVAVVSDGSLYYGLQALATAARHRIGVLVVVVNNKGAVSLQLEMSAKGMLTSQSRQTLSWAAAGFDVAKTAHGLGAVASRVERAEELLPSLKDAILVAESGRPAVVDVGMSPSPEDWEEGWYVPDARSPRT